MDATKAELSDLWSKAERKCRELQSERDELRKALERIAHGAPTEYPERYEGDNHGDTAHWASEATHFGLAQIARTALSQVKP